MGVPPTLPWSHDDLNGLEHDSYNESDHLSHDDGNFNHADYNADDNCTNFCQFYTVNDGHSNNDHNTDNHRNPHTPYASESVQFFADIAW